MQWDPARDQADLPQRGFGAQRFVARATATFFRHWAFFLVPVLLIGGYGAYSAKGKAADYRAIGTLSVEYQTFLGSLSQVRTADGSYEAPGSKTARQFNELMGTEGFAKQVVDGAGLTADLTSGTLKLTKVQSSVYAVSSGDNLMQISAQNADPNRAFALANAAIAAFKDWVTTSEVSASDAAELFYDEQIPDLDDAVTTARNGLTQYLIAHPAPANSTLERDVAEQLQIQNLNDDLTRAQDKYDAAVSKRDDARLASVQSKADIGERFKTIDSPQVPLVPESGLKSKVLSAAVFVILGLLVAAAAVAVSTLLDRSVRSSEDLADVGPDVVAIVPTVRMKASKRDERPLAMATPRAATRNAS